MSINDSQRVADPEQQNVLKSIKNIHEIRVEYIDVEDGNKTLIDTVTLPPNQLQTVKNDIYENTEKRKDNPTPFNNRMIFTIKRLHSKSSDVLEVPKESKYIVISNDMFFIEFPSNSHFEHLFSSLTVPDSFRDVFKSISFVLRLFYDRPTYLYLQEDKDEPINPSITKYNGETIIHNNFRLTRIENKEYMSLLDYYSSTIWHSPNKYAMIYFQILQIFLSICTGIVLCFTVPWTWYLFTLFTDYSFDGFYYIFSQMGVGFMAYIVQFYLSWKILGHFPLVDTICWYYKFLMNCSKRWYTNMSGSTVYYKSSK